MAPNLLQVCCILLRDCGRDIPQRPDCDNPGSLESLKHQRARSDDPGHRAQGQASEWALLKRHASEDCFGVQICTAHPDQAARCVELLDDHCSLDFIDINMGCVAGFGWPLMLASTRVLVLLD